VREDEAVTQDLRAVVLALVAAYDAGGAPERAEAKAAVKATLAQLVDVAPGRAVEVRVPPFAAVQAVGGTTHRRGTPPAVVECDARTWLALSSGVLSWDDAVGDGRLRASGERSDLSEHLPLC
jgi:hypothetical protein